MPKSTFDAIAPGFAAKQEEDSHAADVLMLLSISQPYDHLCWIRVRSLKEPYRQLLLILISAAFGCSGFEILPMVGHGTVTLVSGVADLTTQCM